MKYLISLALVITTACTPSGATKEGASAAMEIDIEAERYSDQTRDLEDRFKEAVYVDLEGLGIDYQSLTDLQMAEVSDKLKAKHRAAIEAFETAFVSDEVTAGTPQTEALTRAQGYVDDYFQSLWDVQIDLNK